MLRLPCRLQREDGEDAIMADKELDDPAALGPALDEVHAALGHELARALEEIALDLQGRMQRYPPALPSKSGYVRTGTLGRGWHVSPVGMGDMITLGNPVSYAPYVQGPTDIQARRMAARGWQSVTVVLQGMTTIIAERIAAAIQRAFDGIKNR